MKLQEVLGHLMGFLIRVKLVTQTWHSWFWALVLVAFIFGEFLLWVCFVIFRKNKYHFNFFIYFLYMSLDFYNRDKNEFIGWRRDYRDPILPVINTPVMVGDLGSSFIADVEKDIYFTLFLEKIYSLSTIRGINLYKFAYNFKGKHSNILMDGDVPVLFVYPPVDVVEDSPNEWYERNRVLIADLVRKYPGLFVMGGGRRVSRRRLRGSRRRLRGSRRRKTKKYMRRRRR